MKKKINELEKIDNFIVDAAELLQNNSGNCQHCLFKCEEKLWEALEVIIDLIEPLRKKKMNIKLEGTWINKSIRMNEQNLDPIKSQEIWDHSPDGFNWGYAGSGPAQLALAILLELTDKQTAINNHQKFKNDIIANLPNTDFSEEIDVEKYLGEINE